MEPYTNQTIINSETEFVILLNFFLPGSKEIQLYAVIGELIKANYKNATFSYIENVDIRREAEKEYDLEVLGHQLTDEERMNHRYEHRKLKKYINEQTVKAFRNQVKEFAKPGNTFHFIGYSKHIVQRHWLKTKDEIDRAFTDVEHSYVPIIQM